MRNARPPPPVPDLPAGRFEEEKDRRRHKKEPQGLRPKINPIDHQIAPPCDEKGRDLSRRLIENALADPVDEEARHTSHHCLEKANHVRLVADDPIDPRVKEGRARVVKKDG